MRHAKSSWKQPGLPDWERPLNKRGRKDAPGMGRFLLGAQLTPELIIASTAARARETAQAVDEAAEYDGDIVYLDDLYGGTPLDYARALRAVSDAHDVVLIVGHNPDTHDVLEVLCDESEDMPTAAIAHVELPIERWADLRDGIAGRLVRVWRPRELG